MHTFTLTLETSAVMKTLRKQVVEKIYVKISKDMYKESTATIKLRKLMRKK